MGSNPSTKCHPRHLRQKLNIGQNPPGCGGWVSCPKASFLLIFEERIPLIGHFCITSESTAPPPTLSCASQFKCFPLGSFCLEMQHFQVKKPINQIPDFHFKTWQNRPCSSSGQFGGDAPHPAVETPPVNTSPCQPCQGSALRVLWCLDLDPCLGFGFHNFCEARQK